MNRIVIGNNTYNNNNNYIMYNMLLHTHPHKQIQPCT